MRLPWHRNPDTPAPLAEAPDPAPVAAPRLASWRRRILVVEDDEELWPVIERYSSRAQPGSQVEFARSAHEAEARLASGAHYDVIVADDCLPDEGAGSELLVRAQSLQPCARRGMISAHGGHGAPPGTPFLPKPFSPSGYRRFLRELLGWSAVSRAI